MMVDKLVEEVLYRWGRQLEESTYKYPQHFYLGEQTDGSVPNTLLIAKCDVVKRRVAAAEHIAKFDENARSPFVKIWKTILHPGEVNRIRELPENNKIVATHTDSPNVLIWNVETQYRREPVKGAKASRPDLVLIGHQDNADFALAMSQTEHFVLSGGKDKLVVLWSIHDHISSLALNCGPMRSTDNRTVRARGIFQGHRETVEDVQFCPSSAQEFCSVGDDCCLILWDARTGSAPVVKVEKAHEADLHCVDWNANDANLILTGSADNSICIYDRRKLSSGGVRSPVQIFQGHSDAVLCVQWCPSKTSVFASGAEDGNLNIWDYEKVGNAGTRPSNCPPGLFFQHAGHRGRVVEFHWNASDPWTMMSLSGEKTGRGGTLQIWRVMDMLYRPEEDVLAELNELKSHVRICSS
ncbi:WD-40 repeat-containing protein MSI4-like isoform X1 [Olea europaea var. sylvestris]|uniref:WD-40 repeat-containing protein MSI4-like isoform X1 n=1 Tax=Olea europaea var. sylvestris TaxID=158386 RepID=UPI000C1D3CA5|nr:WD-40 repeat-containing protein MSI4-like isoform X1 [Olea europaea var. sylvestris]XP_022844466.1 WD-40 repeat-containing protein MSI4-like isoform X1 [Olea europaea var. sylvestris]